MGLRLSVKHLCRLVCIFSFSLVLSGFNSRPAFQMQDGSPIVLKQFDLMTESAGWVLLGQQLFWTSDAGQTWTEISPSLPAEASVEGVQFLDSAVGRVLASISNPDGSARFQLFQTDDGGLTWMPNSLSLFELGEVATYVEKAEMGWFDSQTGWISVKQASGSNFSIGALFRTSDGGNSWSHFALPVADQIYFSDPFTGWALIKVQEKQGKERRVTDPYKFLRQSEQTTSQFANTRVSSLILSFINFSVLVTRLFRFRLCRYNLLRFELYTQCLYLCSTFYRLIRSVLISPRIFQTGKASAYNHPRNSNAKQIT